MRERIVVGDAASRAGAGGAGAGGVFWRESLLAWRPHNGAHRVAVRAVISSAVPLTVLLLIGHPEWAPWAAFGAFTALYGRNRVHLSRLAMQLTAAGVLVAMVGLGSLVATLPAPTWPMIVLGAILAGAGLPTVVAAAIAVLVGSAGTAMRRGSGPACA